ncbi:hypothetical protein CVS28_16850 [Arthrobacter glacialis]|uniref:Uncharacterized protein n=1 Tax=Arthrobacter glacialis TaxID=1664 RepID=A0A2S3ZT24_ARTGL|nr:hypothetical protein CVS28_16850 [Arthrobacter glacialis]POH72406.1 hypothetical protein CVS27_16105 [Arthrobacter glacialis]
MSNRRSLRLQATLFIILPVLFISFFTEATTMTMKVIYGGGIILCLVLLGTVIAKILKLRKRDTGGGNGS